MITKRDQDVINFIEKFKIANTSTIQELFYPSLRVCQRRLKELYDYKYIKRERNHFTNEYNYFIQKPKQIRHSILLTDFYRELHKIQGMSVVRFDNEFSVGNVRADGFIAYQYGYRKYIAFVEVELSNKGLDTKKYKKLYLSGEYKNYFPIFPLVIVVGNKKIKFNEDFKIVRIDEDMGNIDDIFK